MISHKGTPTHVALVPEEDGDPGTGFVVIEPKIQYSLGMWGWWARIEFPNGDFSWTGNDHDTKEECEQTVARILAARKKP